MEKALFDWDAGNTKHVISDYPERRNTTEDVESVFDDPNKVIRFNKYDPVTGKPRFVLLGIGNRKIVQYVVFEKRNGKFRPITCYPAKGKAKALYYENLSKTSGGSKT